MTKLFIATPTHSTHGGVETILEALATHLPSRGLEVTFGLAKGRFHDAEAFRRVFPSVRGVDVDAASGTMFGRRRALRRAILDADPDVVLIARLFDAYPVVSELKLGGHRVRLAVTVQAFESAYFVDLARYRDFIDACVTSGALIARAAREIAGLAPLIVRNIPGGVAPATRTAEHSDGPLRIGYVGRLEETQKRILDLPRLVAELERRGIPFTLDIAGDGSAMAELRERLPSARYYGWLTQEALYTRIYPELDVFVHFAEWEGVTIAPREAMAHGAVPVVSRFAGMAEERQFLNGENALTFPVGDVAAAADAIERLHRDRAYLARLSRAARASQTGIRSAQGAIDAWADALHGATLRPSHKGTVLPPAPSDSGVLTRLGFPDALAELVRGKRRVPPSSPGAEWPHWSGMGDEEVEQKLRELLRK